MKNVVSSVLSVALAFNFDTNQPYIKEGPSGSNFGYAVGNFKFSDNRETLIVSAPTLEQDGLKLGGVFQCPFSPFTNDCFGITTDLTSAYNNSLYGLSMATDNGKLITCAPKFKKKGSNTRDESAQVESLVGTCHLWQQMSGQGYLRQEDNRLLASPVEHLSHPTLWRSRQDTFHFAKAEFGLSVSVDNDEFVIGGGGTHSWSGSIVAGEYDDLKLADSPYCTKADVKKDDNIYKRCGKLSQTQDSYGGTSTLIMKNVSGHEGRTIYVSGMPGDGGYGSVRFYYKSGGRLSEITSLALEGREKFAQAFQMGAISHEGGLASSFGYALASTDLNGDGLDDLIVGAPQYFDYAEEIGGAVFVFFSDPSERGFSTFKLLTGPRDSAFGSSLTSLGDADIDNYGDFCVGAPHINHKSGNSGSIFMFNGQRAWSSVPSQIITADEIAGDRFVQYFGRSMKGDIHSDDDDHPDLIVGAKDLVIVLRARPIISITSDISITDVNGRDVSVIDLDESDSVCTEDGVDYQCYEAKICFSFNKATIKQLGGKKAVNMTIIVDKSQSDKQLTARARVGGWSRTTNRLMKQTELQIQTSGEKCLDPVKVFLSNEMEDKLTPIDISIDFTLNEETTEFDANVLSPLVSQPVIRINGDRNVLKSIPITNNCKADNYCEDNFIVNHPQLYILNENEEWETAGVLKFSSETDPKMKWTADVSNLNGEDAYNAEFTVVFPSHTKLYKAEISSHSGQFDCKEHAAMSYNSIDCKVGNPFKAGSMETVSLYLDVIYQPDNSPMEGGIKIRTHKTMNPHLADPNTQLQRQGRGPSIFAGDYNYGSDMIMFSFGQMIYESEVELIADSSPRFISTKYTSTSAIEKATYFDELGAELMSTVILRNNGRTPARNMLVHMKIPTFIKKHHLLYPVSANILIRGELNECMIKNAEFNPMQLNHNQRQRRDASDSSSIADMFVRYTPEIHQLDCDHDKVRCAEIICQVESLNSNELAQVEFKSILTQSTLHHHFSGSQTFDISWSSKVTSDSPLKGKRSSTTTIRVDQDVTVAHNDYFYWSWWIIALIAFGIMFSFVLILSTLYLCGFFQRRSHFAC